MSRKYVRPLMNEKTCPVARQLTRQVDSLKIMRWLLWVHAVILSTLVLSFPTKSP